MDEMKVGMEERVGWYDGLDGMKFRVGMRFRFEFCQCNIGQ